MPSPSEGESQKEFISRCMDDSKSKETFPDQDQRYAFCVNTFEDSDYTASIETVEALQYGKPKKDDVRKTPAKPDERRKGSKKNKKDSASKPNKSIKMSKETETRIRKLMEEHNKKVSAKGKGSKAGMGALKSVFRRGTGAFSRSHAPNMSRSGWGVARVKAFLYLLRNGRPSNPNYKQDNDLLPKSHPRSSAKAQEDDTMNEEEFYYYELAEYEDWGIESDIIELSAAEYKGRKVKLNKPFRTQGGPKKFAVYVQNSSGRVIIVRFGDPNMEIKRDDPKRRKAFRDRHDCANKKDKTTAGYWSCRQWSTNKVEADDNMKEYEEFYEADEKPCCDSCGENAIAAEPKPSADETHGEYMSRCQEAGYSEEECMAAHEGHSFKEEAGYYDDEEKKASCDSECAIGEELIDGECVRVAVTCEIEIDSIETRIEASTGKTIMRISGIAFTDGINKNSWGIRSALAKTLVDDMVGADVTLNHPKAKMGRFTRNMDGGVDEANVGVITEASYHERKNGYQVRYVAEVARPELFASLESGMWMQPDYGVSIGGTGIPSEIIEASKEGGRPTMWFADDFEFDHLAIVHRPAYSEANIEIAEKVEASEIFMYQTDGSDNQPKVKKMSDEIIEDVSASEMEALRAELVLREAKIAEFEAAELARVEESRVALVNKASEMGLKGHDDFTMETLNTMIASWEASRPVVEEPTIEMAPAVPASSEPVEASEVSEPVVANYLNGKLVESSESLYARCYNSWANAYNSVMAGEAKALTYEEIQ